VKVSDVIRAGLRREPEPAAPPPRNLRREYVDAVAAFVEAKRRGTAYAAVAAAQRLRDLRGEAVAEGFGEQMERAWEEPQPHADHAWLRWYEQRIEHLLHGGPDPGPRPWQQNEWSYWAQLYRERCAALVAAYRSGSPGAIADAEGRFWNLTKEATTLGGFHDEVGRRFMGVPARRGDDWIERWRAEAEFKLRHARPSGSYVEPPLPRPFVRMSELQAAEQARHSAVILLAERDGQPPGTWLRLDPATSWDLVESGRAAWCQDGPKPPDTRPPVVAEPGDDWVMVRFLRPVKLTTRHLVGDGDVRRIAPDEAAALIRIGAAEEFVEPPPPPPPPPKPVVLFE